MNACKFVKTDMRYPIAYKPVLTAGTTGMIGEPTIVQAELADSYPDKFSRCLRLEVRGVMNCFTR